MYGAALSVLHWGAGFWGGLASGVVRGDADGPSSPDRWRMRLTWHYFAIITVVFSLIFYFAAMSAKPSLAATMGSRSPHPPVFDAFGLKLSLADMATQYTSS